MRVKTRLTSILVDTARNQRVQAGPVSAALNHVVDADEMVRLHGTGKRQAIP